jgi:uncharacterized delta-60 repeat protein/uncharacterized repeat protein (TIGR01451 family)
MSNPQSFLRKLGSLSFGLRISLLAVLVFSLTPLSRAAAPPAPTNDLFSKAIVITNISGAITNSNAGATAESGEPSHGGFTAAHSIWYKWVAPASGEVSFDTFGVPAGLDTVLAVYTGTNVANLCQVSANDDLYPTTQQNEKTIILPPAVMSQPINTNPATVGSTIYTQPYNGPSSLRFNAAAGTTYYIAIDSKFATGPIPLHWSFHPAGVFRFATEDLDTPGSGGILYQCSDLESEADDSSTTSTYYQFNPGGLLVTVTRVAGSSGRVVLNVDTADGSAVAPIDYTPVHDTLVFDNFEMSKTLKIVINPFLLLGSPDRQFTITLSNARLAPFENTNVVSAPVVDPTYSTAIVRILSLTSPVDDPKQYPTVDSNGMITAQANSDIFNFIKVHYYLPKDVLSYWGSAGIWVARTLAQAKSDGPTINFRVNCYPEDNAAVDEEDNNRYPLNPGSDYATPTPPNSNFIHGTNSDFNLADGSVAFGANIAEIRIPFTVNNDAITKFNKDFMINLYRSIDNARRLPGEVSEAHITILFNDTNCPAGSVDEFYNPDFSDAMVSQQPIVTEPRNMPHPGTDGTVYDLALQPDDRAIVVGQFATYNGVSRNGIARINTDGSIDSSFDPGLGADDFITSIALLPNGQMLIGGAFTSFNGSNRTSIARLNSDGSIDPSFNVGVPGISGTIWAIAVQSDGNILIGGEFTSVAGFSRPYIARLNGTNGVLDTSFNPTANSPDGVVQAITVMPSGQIVIAGQFTHLGATPLNHLAQLNPNGTADASFNNNLGSAFDQTVWTLAQAGGKLLAGGDFTVFGGIPRNRIVRLNANGSIDSSFNPGSGASDTVLSISPQSDGTIYVGGQFTSFNGTHRLSFARLFADGSVDTRFLDTAYNQFAGFPRMYFDKQSLGDSLPIVYVSQTQSDGNPIVGGSFTRVGGGQASPLTRFDPDFSTNNQSVYIEPKSRDGIRNRSNVARLLGGATPGPGNISLLSTNLVVNRSVGSLNVGLTRTNGALGFASANFAVLPGLAQAGSFSDYAYYDTAPIYLGTWRQTAFLPSAANSTTRRHIDGLFSTNTSPVDIYGNYWFRYTPGAAIISLPGNGGNGAGDVDTRVQLSNPAGADNFYLGGANIPLGLALGGGSIAPFTIHDDTKKTNFIGFASANFFANETSSNAIVTLVRTNASGGTVSVKLSTSDGSAHAGVNYVGQTNINVSFGAGVLTQTVAIPLIDDSVSEPNGLTVNLRLSGISGASYAITNAVLNILDNDGSPGVINFSATSYGTNLSSGAVLLTVNRSGADRGTLSVQFATTNGNATHGIDYLGFTNILTWNDFDFAPRVLSIPLLNSGTVGPNLNFQAYLSNPLVNNSPFPSALGASNRATVTITNDNSFGKLQFSSPAYSVSENGGFATLTVVRVGGAAQTLTVHYSTADSTAVSTGPTPNYVATSGNLTFNPGEVSKSFNIPILNDGIIDPTNFFFFVNLSSPTPPGVLGSIITVPVNIVDAQRYNQPAGSPDTAFTPNPGLDSDVYSLALQPDGKVVVAGNFNFANGAPRGHVARFNSDGSLDTGFLATDSGANGPVQSVLVQSNGRILAGGSFSSANGVGRSRIARFMPDGFLDSSFNGGAGADNNIFAMAETFIGPNRAILIGGSFLNVDGLPRSSLARLNDDCSLDMGFDPGLTINGTVYAIAVYPTNTIQAGKIIIGGDFTAVDGTNYNGVARLNPDGTLDLSFNPGAGATNAVRALALQSDGRILVGGSFTTFNGSFANHLTRLNIDGSTDSSFNAGLGADDTVQAFAVQQDTRIVVVGQFTHASGVSRSRITRLMPDGTVDPAINFGAGADAIVNTVAIQPDGMLVIGGGFSSFDSLPRPHLARLYGGAIAGSGSFQFTAANYQADETSTNAILTIRRFGGTAGDVSVNFATLAITAVPGVNFSNVSATLDFPLGETFQSVSIPLIHDFQVTPDLIVSNSLSGPLPPSSLGDQSFCTLTILNDDSTVSFDSDNFAVQEDVVGGAFFVPVVRAGSSRITSTVDFMTTTNGTAVPGVDYSPVTNTVTFQPGESVQLVPIPIFNVPSALNPSTVSMQLTNPVNTVLVNPSQSTLTINVTNQAPGMFLFAQTNYSVGEGDGSLTLTVLRTNGHTGLISVSYATADISAVAGVNYTNVSGSLSFADGETVKTITVPIIDEKNVEAGGFSTFSVGLSNPTGGATINTPTNAIVAIIDNDSGVAFSSPIFIGTETDGSISIGVNRVGTNDITKVSYATSDGTATNGSQYQGVTNQLTFNRGESFKSFNINFLRDTNVTGDLFFNLTLFGATNLLNPSTQVQIFTNNPAVVTIKDADPGLLFTNSTFGVLKSGTNVTITVLRSNVNTGTVSVHFSTADGTASAGADYTAVSGVLTFSNGVAAQSFTVPIRNNLQAQDDRFFSVLLSAPSVGAQLLPPSVATVFITNDTSGIAFSSSGYTVTEGGAISINVFRSGYTNGTVSVDFATANGSATTANYFPTNGTLVFTNGELFKSFLVRSIDDGVVTNNHTVLLGLSGVTGSAVLLTPNQAVLTILESDGSLVVPAGAALVSESGPINGAIDPGENVSVNFALRASLGTNVTDVTATLLATNGVSSPSPASRDYGSLIAGGPSVSQQFSFSAAATNGQVISATLQLRYGGSTNLVVFNFLVGQVTNSFTNSSSIVINDFTNATPYPSTMAVTGVGNFISSAVVTVTNLYHSHPSDIDMLLVSPTGTNSYLMAKAGGSAVLNPGVTITFSDSASSSLPQGQITSGTYKPTSFAGANPNFPPPAPFSVAPGFYRTNLATFNGGNPNGVWQLFVIDDSQGNTGVITNGWILRLTTAQILGASDLAVGLAAAPNPVVVTSNLTYTLFVTNFGPSISSNITLTDVFPTNAVYVTNSTTSGSASINPLGALVWNIPFLPNSGVASNTLVIRPGSVGLITNSLSVATATLDPNPDDDSASLVTSVADFSADLALNMVVLPNPVLLGGSVTYSLTVSNLGPATATSVSVSDTLPDGFQFISASPAGFTVVGNIVTFTNLGSIGSGSQLSATVVAQPLEPGTFTAVGHAQSPVLDPLNADNFALVKTVAETLSVQRSGSSVVLSWPSDLGSVTVVSNASLAHPVWSPVTAYPQVPSGGFITVTIPVGPGTTFFRLRSP